MFAYDLGTGEAMPPSEAVPATDADLRGTRERVLLRSTINDGGTSETPVDIRLGPGDQYAVVGGDGGGLVVIDATTHKRLPLTGVVGTGFKLVRWQNGSAFFGLALATMGSRWR